MRAVPLLDDHRRHPEIARPDVPRGRGLAAIHARRRQIDVLHESGVDLLLAPADGERGEEVTDRVARQVIHALRARYDVVIIDCGTQMGAANTTARQSTMRAGRSMRLPRWKSAWNSALVVSRSRRGKRPPRP